MIDKYLFFILICFSVFICFVNMSKKYILNQGDGFLLWPL